VAEAGPAQTVYKSGSLVLDGSGSSDPDGDALEYQWTQVAGPAVTLSDATSAMPSLTAPAVSGTLQFELVVSDGRKDSVADSVAITVANRAPVANAGVNMMMAPAYVVTLDGQASSDPDGDTLVRTWTQKSGPAMSLHQNGNGTMSFTTPSFAAILEFTLVVSDGETTSSDDLVVVVQAGGGGNGAPVADAGSDVTAPRRSFVYLTGYGYDPDYDTLSYAWAQTSGPAVTLEDPDSPYPAFVAPEDAADLQFTLTVSDGTSSSQPDTVTVHVRNHGPVITAFTLTPAEPGTLDDLHTETLVEDYDNDPVTLVYRWEKNGSVIAGQTGPTLPEGLHVKSDSITVTVTASDSWQDATAEDSVVIRDTPAVLAGSPPAEIGHGEHFTFQVSASDPDGDVTTGEFEIDHGPAGMTIDEEGVVSWQVTDPMFDRGMDFHWQVALRGQADAVLAGSVTVNDDDRQYPLRRNGISIPVYDSGLVIADLDDDGDSEVLVGSGKSLYELARVGTAYQESWVYPFASRIQGVTAADVDGDGPLEIFYASARTVVKLGGVGRRESARNSSANVYCRDIEARDLDADGTVELVCLGSVTEYGSEMRLIVFDAATLGVEWQSAEPSLGRTMALGNVDADAAHEIVTSAGFVFDGASLANQWTYGPGFGDLVDTGDLDGNGVEEIVGVQGWNAFRGFDAVLKSPIWERTGFDFDAVLVANIDGDAPAEIIIGDGQWGNVTAYNYVPATNTLSQAWAINSQDHGVTSIAAGNVDDDGGIEIVWGSGASSSGEDVFVVAGFNPGIGVEWTNSNPNELDGPFFGARLAALGGGAERVVFGTGSTDSGYSGLRLISLDYATGLIEPSSEIGSNWAGGGALEVADYDLDGTDEALLTTAHLYDGYFSAFDLGADQVEWSSPQNIGTGRAITRGDMNGDDHTDMIVLTHDGHVHIYDLHNETLIWTSTGSSGGGQDVAVADLDGDDTLEVIATIGNQVYAWQKTAGPTGYLQIGTYALGNARDLEIFDADGDGAPEIYVLASQSYSGGAADVVRLDAQLGLLNTLHIGMTVYSLHVEDSGVGRRNLLLSASESDDYWNPAAILLAIDAQSGAEVWRSPILPGTVSLNSLSYMDVDGDGEREIAFATGEAMYVTR
jgi:hypothetical protein